MSIIDDAAMDLTTTACQEQQPQPQPPKRLPLLDHQCSHCFAERSPALKNLYICSGCRVVRYCSRDHQLAHWSTHKPLCLPIKRVKAIAESEERKISMNPGSFKGRNGAQEGWEAFYMPGNPFEHAIDFWGWEATRTYMQARWGLVDGLRRINTTEALGWALGHAMGVLQLNRSDALGVRFMIPAMMIRLGNDQEAYDFVKWWAIYGRRDSKYDWGDPDAPYLHLHGENMMEDVSLWQDETAELADQLVLLLIKLRLLLNRQRRIRETLARRVDQEPIEVARKRKDSANSIDERSQKCPNEKYIRDRPWEAREASDDSMDEVKLPRSKRTIDRLTNEGAMLQSQATALVKTVQHGNGRLLLLLLAERAPPVWVMNSRLQWDMRARILDGWSNGRSREAMQLVLQYTYDSWIESPGALQWLRECREMQDVI